MSDNLSKVPVEVLDDSSLTRVPPSLSHVSDGYDVFSQRRNLIRIHHDERGGILDRLKNSDGSSTSEIMDIAIEEIARTVDDLKGNELIFLKDGLLHDATSIAVKRTDIIEAIARMAIKKQEIAKASGEVDLNSPTFQIFQQICIDKLRYALDMLHVDPELKQLIIMKWGEGMDGWDKELKSRMVKIEQNIHGK